MGGLERVKKCRDEPSGAPRQRAKARATTLAPRSARGLEWEGMCGRGGGRHNDLAAHDHLVVTAFAVTKSGQRSFPRAKRGAWSLAVGSGGMDAIRRICKEL